MKTVGKKLLSLLLVVALAASVLPFAAFAAGETCPNIPKDAKKPEQDKHKLTHTEASPGTCTAKGNLEYWTCSECNKNYGYVDDSFVELTSTEGSFGDHNKQPHGAVPGNCKTGVAGTKAYDECTVCHKLFNADGEVIEAPETDPAGHNKVWHDAKAADCQSGEKGYEAYYECSVCGQLFDGTDSSLQIAAPVVTSASHKDTNNDGICDFCGKTIQCTINFEVVRIDKDGVETKIPFSNSSMTVAQGNQMGYPVPAPECPRGYAYERVNSSVWRQVVGGVMTEQTYNTMNVVTVGTTEITYRAIQREQTMNLTVAFRVDGKEYIFKTFDNIPYKDTVDANGNGVAVYTYLREHDMNGKPCAYADSVMKKFETDFKNKTIRTTSGENIDVTGYTWTDNQSFLSGYSNNSINNGALTMNINYGAISTDIKVYANLKAQTSFTITFAPMSPYGSNAAVQGSFGKAAVTLNSLISGLPTPTCSGYIFMGWYDEPMKGPMNYVNGVVTLDVQNNGATHYVNGTKYTVRSDVTLYPYWIPEVEAWVVVHNNKDGNISSMAKIQGVKPTDTITKTTVLAHVKNYTAGNYTGPIVSDSNSFNDWTKPLMGASVVTEQGKAYYFHVYAPGASAQTVVPAGNSGANGGSVSGSGSVVDPSNPKTGDLARNNLNVACAALAVSVIAMGAVVCTFPKKKEI